MDALDDSSVGVALIPTGEVLYRLDGMLRGGSIAGMSSVEDLYRDEVHLNEAGRWVAGAVASAVILDADPHVFGKPIGGWYGDGSAFPAGFIPLVQDVIADVLIGG